MNFAPDHIFHIYNRGNNSQRIFFQRKNYLFFLKKRIRRFSLIICTKIHYVKSLYHIWMIGNFRRYWIIQGKEMVT